jgi:hypothetical protein
MQHTAFENEFGSGGSMNGAVHTTTAQERSVRRVDDRVNAQCRNIGDDNLEPRLAELSRREAQAEAAALSSTPLSANSCCNSPAWNISRMMSQPPTNSPLT